MDFPAHQLTMTVLMTPNTANFAVNDRRPVPVTQLQPFTLSEKRRHAAAIVRKSLRQEYEQRAPRPGSSEAI